MLGVLTTLMDITEAEIGAIRLNKRVENLALIAREAVELYDLVSSERGVHMVTRLAPGVFVSVDRARIRQALANLIDNAIKYTAPGGQIKITVSRARRMQPSKSPTPVSESLPPTRPIRAVSSESGDCDRDG